MIDAGLIAHCGVLTALWSCAGRLLIAAGAMAFIGDNPVEVVGAEIYSGKMPKALEASECMRTDNGIAVMTGEGGLLITSVRLEEDDVLSGRALHALLD